MLSIHSPDAIRKNNAVITANGLVGKIIKVSNHYAICQILLDPNCKVSVHIQRNRELGIVSWDGAKHLLLENIPNTIEVRKGDVLLTSGMSRIYPPNIKVGVVISVRINEDAPFQTIHVKPAVPFNRIEEVFILQDVNNEK
jgi:rod shape-determining protein MreC